MLTLEIYFNRITARSDENPEIAVIEYTSTFSNHRLIVSDFTAFSIALKDVLEQAATQKIYTAQNPLTGKLLATTVRLDVREELQGGLSSIEAKVLREAMIANNLRGREICYQGTPVTINYD